MGQSLFNVGRKLTPTEWGELKAWRVANPGLKRRSGEINQATGLWFRGYARNCKNGESWVLEEKYQAFLEGASARALAHYHRDPKKAAETLRARRLKDPDQARSRARAYYAKSCLRYRAKRQQRYAASRGEIAIHNQQPHVKERRSRRIRQRYADDALFAVAQRCRSRVAGAFRSGGFKKGSKTGDALGCSWEELQAYIESKFAPGMSWGNRRLWHIDHVVPLASAKTEEELLDLCRYTNLQPLWAADNFKKSDKMPHELLA